MAGEGGGGGGGGGGGKGGGGRGGGGGLFFTSGGIILLKYGLILSTIIRPYSYIIQWGCIHLTAGSLRGRWSPFSHLVLASLMVD